MSIANEHQFRNWLESQNRWSKRGQSDLVSRLRRADEIVSLQSVSTVSSYLANLEKSQAWLEIPATSRTGIRAAARLYLEWFSRGA